MFQLFLNAETLHSQTALGEDKSTEISAASLKPIIHFEKPDFDFGKIYKGDKVEHVYQFENRGNETLKIKKVLKSAPFLLVGPLSWCARCEAPAGCGDFHRWPRT